MNAHEVYIGFTIGPIYETILEVLAGDHKTRKLYAGSRYFSHFMQIVLEKLCAKEGIEILVPWGGVSGCENFQKKLFEESYTGLFHDRLIAKSSHEKQKSQDLFSSILAESYEAMAAVISKDTNNQFSGDNIINAMDNHSVVLDRDELLSINDNIIFAINQMLDIMELRRSFSYKKDKNPILSYQENWVNKHSLPIKDLETISSSFGYYAVVVADGDKMGALIRDKATERVENITKISQDLYNFFTQTDIADLTNNRYGGQLIYAGGDDVLAFLPARYIHADGNSHTFVDYFTELSDKFKKYVGSEVSMSFGVSLVYHKHPLRLAIQDAMALLHVAKSYAPNSVALRLRKHSGQWYENTLTLDSSAFKPYKDLINGILIQDLQLPHAIHHTLSRYKGAILQLYAVSPAHSALALFDTIFDDSRGDDEAKAIGLLREYIDAVAPRNIKEFDGLYSSLNVLKFLRGDRHELSTDA